MKPDDFDARVSLPKDHAFRYPAHEPAPHELGIPAGTAEPMRLRIASEIEQERLARKTRAEIVAAALYRHEHPSGKWETAPCKPPYISMAEAALHAIDKMRV